MIIFARTFVFINRKTFSALMNQFKYQSHTNLKLIWINRFLKTSFLTQTFTLTISKKRIEMRKEN